ncbi:MAG: metal ABC transporter solute-binding protein, Zn/Mn family [Mangrovibacterium sp.]
MRYYIFIIAIIISSCTSKQNTNSRPLVAVSIVPQEYFVRNIADTLVDVMILVEPGSSPELYELRAAQMAKLSQASAWLGIGEIDFELSWKTKILESNPNLLFFNCSKEVNIIASEIVNHGDHQHKHGVDPHTWTSAKEGLKIAHESYLALCKLLPEHHELLQQNYRALCSEIEALDQEIEQILSSSTNKNFLIFHPSLGYFARDYGLTQIPLEIEGKEPSPKYIQEFIQQSKDLNLNKILIQKEFSKSIANQLSKEINGEVIEINPLGSNWAAELINIAHIISNSSKQ